MSLLSAVVMLGASGCDGAFVNLGSGDASSGNGGGSSGRTPDAVWSVASEPLLTQVEGLQLSSPTLTADEQHLYYSEQPRGADPEPFATLVRHAVRSRESFAPSAPLSVAEGDRFGVASPVVSAKGDELWFSRLSERGDADIWRSTGQGDDWAEPELMAELNSAFDDAARPPGSGGTVMPLSSKRHGGLLYQIYFATRSTVDATWNRPNQDHLGRINSPDYLSADAVLSADGLALYFASTRGGTDADLYVARRIELDADFAEPEPLRDLNTPSEERMPWLSADEHTIYFASNRPTGFEQYALFVATRSAPDTDTPP